MPTFFNRLHGTKNLVYDVRSKRRQQKRYSTVNTQSYWSSTSGGLCNIAITVWKILSNRQLGLNWCIVTTYDSIGSHPHIKTAARYLEVIGGLLCWRNEFATFYHPSNVFRTFDSHIQRSAEFAVHSQLETSYSPLLDDCPPGKKPHCRSSRCYSRPETCLLPQRRKIAEISTHFRQAYHDDGDEITGEGNEIYESKQLWRWRLFR